MKNLIRWLTEAGELRSMHWRCLGCGHLSHFSKPKPIETAIPCPKCPSHAAEPVS